MEAKMLKKIYQPSEDVVAREIAGEMILVPVVSGIGDLEDELYSLNDSGKALWKKLNGKKSLEEISEEFAKEYAAPPKEIREDISGLAKELFKRKMLVEVKRK